MSQTFDELAEIAGKDVACKVVSEFGGTEIFFPKPEHVADSHQLAVALGADAARLLCARLSGNWVLIPMEHTKATERSRKHIEGLLRAGEMSVPEIARACGVTERTIYNHKARMRKERNQRLRLLAQAQDMADVTE